MLVIRSVELLHAPGSVDVLVGDGRVAEVAPRLVVPSGAEVLDGGGGTLLPGLHDHHVHLFATAAARGSVRLDDARDLAAVADRLRTAVGAAPSDGWLRATGYHAGPGDPLDRAWLDGVVPDRPVRVQHRSGAQWTLNSAALGLLPLAEAGDGVERDGEGRPTGRLHRLDHWLRRRLPASAAPDLAGLLADLVARGVTGVTDTTPWEHEAELATLADAVVGASGAPHVVATGGPALATAAMPAPLGVGPVKVVVDDATYPALDELVAATRAAHAAGRGVAVHCVTRPALALCLAMWNEAGARRGDRLEHGAVIPPGERSELARLGITVVTQPGFVAERGDDYLVEVDAEDRPWLYPCRSLLDAGVPVAFGSDGPYASVDPWATIAAAVARATRAGVVLGPDERVGARVALERHLGPLSDPGGPARRVEAGAPADLCLLRQPLADLLADPAAAEVAWVRTAGPARR